MVYNIVPIVFQNIIYRSRDVSVKRWLSSVHNFITLWEAQDQNCHATLKQIIRVICLSSDHHLHKLLQRKLGHRSAKRVYGCEAGSCFRGGRRGCVQDHPGTYWTLSELFWKHDHKHGWRGNGVLLGTVGVRWLEQSQLRHRRNKKPFEVIIILYNNSRYLYMSTPAKQNNIFAMAQYYYIWRKAQRRYNY